MRHGKFVTKPKRVEEQFVAVNDLKLQMTLAALADKYSEAARARIYQTYQDDEIAAVYRRIRASGIYQKGGRSKVHRKIVEFPNVEVYDFVDSVMSELKGPDWMQNKRNFSHELIRPWLVVDKL